MMHKYDLWFVVQRDGQDVAAARQREVELARPTEENVMALLLDLEYAQLGYSEDGNTEIPISCERQLNGNWRIGVGDVLIELRLKI